MQFDRTAGQENLETPRKPQPARRSREELPSAAALITRAAQCPAHGCCEVEWSQDWERWDGME